MISDGRVAMRAGLLRRLAGTAGTAGATGLLVALAPTAATAAAQDGGRGVIGINIVCESGVPIASCDQAPRIESVGEGSPAEAAGLRLGDRLVSINGVRVNSAEGLDVMSAMVSGTAVRLGLLRDGQTVDAEVVPRRSGLPRIYSVAPAGPRRPPFVFRMDSLRGGANSFVFVGPDERGRISVRVSDSSGTDSVLVRFLERQAAEGQAATYVLEGEHLVARVRASEDLLLNRVRESLEALARASAAGEPAPAATQVLRRRMRLTPSRFAAGAEFVPLTPALAAKVGGPEKGLFVVRVLPDTPAARIGLEDGDVVTHVGGELCSDLDQLHAAFERGLEAQRIVVEWRRGGTKHTGMYLTNQDR